MQRAPGRREESRRVYLAAPEEMERPLCRLYRRSAGTGRGGQDGEDLGSRRGPTLVSLLREKNWWNMCAPNRE